jgi:hypothetical protein
LDIFDSPNFAIKLLGPTRLAKKYQVDWVLKQVASQLKKRWPTTVMGWDGIVNDEEEEDICTMFGPPADYVYDGTHGGRHFLEPASSILLARECDVPTILPFAFFTLLAWRWVFNDETDAYLASLKNVPRRDLVSRDDWCRVLEARERIGGWFYAARQKHSWKPCGSDMACQITTSETWLSIAENNGPNGDFLRSARQAVTKLKQSRSICLGCKKNLLGRIETLRWDFVNQLDEFFQL